MTDRLLTPQDVADYCQLSTKSVLRAIQDGRLPAVRLGTRGGFRIRADDMDAWIAASAVQPTRRSVTAEPVVTPPSRPVSGRLELPPPNGRRGYGEPEPPARMRP